MKTNHYFILLVALLGSATAHETEASEKLSKKRNHFDQKRLEALQMDTTDISKDVSSDENDDDNISIESMDAPKPEESPGPPLERVLVEAQVILSTVHIDNLSSEEIMYFESTLRKAIQLAQDQNRDNEEEVTIGAILVEHGHGPLKNDDGNNRALRGRKLGFGWFNIAAIIEVIRCSFCHTYDDDDTSDKYEEWLNAKPSSAPTGAPSRARTVAPTSRPTHTVHDDYFVNDDYIAWYNDHIRNSGGRRHLGVSESSSSLEDMLCRLLREGPYECFHSVDECALVVSKW